MAHTTSAAWSLLFGGSPVRAVPQHRQRYFDHLDRAAALATLVTGSSTVVALLASVGEGLVLAAAAATAAGACAAVFMPGRRARQHNDLSRESSAWSGTWTGRRAT